MLLHHLFPCLTQHIAIRVSLDAKDTLFKIHSGFWIHAMNGNVADHFVARTRARAVLPLIGGLGAGIEYILYGSTRTYEAFPDVSAHRSEWRVFAAAGW